MRGKNKLLSKFCLIKARKMICGREENSTGACSNLTQFKIFKEILDKIAKSAWFLKSTLKQSDSH